MTTGTHGLQALRAGETLVQEEMHPYSMGGAYVNFLGEGEDPGRVRATYRGHYDRLAQVKKTYDPDNVFHATQNIRPAAPPQDS